MKRTIGIILLVIGVLLGVMALTRHEDDKKILDLGKVEIKNENADASRSTTIYYVLAGICLVAGGVLVAGKKA